MKLDMHCHVKEGSVDSRVTLDEYITLLEKQGFDGMLITDHDTYKGYRHWKNKMKNKVHKDFVVLKGIEYDTRDAGHIIVIMPEGVKMRLLELKGMPVAVLIDLVHRNGGILGPAHPCGEKYLSIMNTVAYKKNPDIMHRFDFVEGFNACESDKSNRGAKALAQKYDKICIGGSDSHKQDCVGLGYTILPKDVSCETELIDMIHSHIDTQVGGSFYNRTLKDRIGRVNKLLVYGFWFYNRGGGMLKQRLRNRNMEPENPTDPIDPIELYYMEQQERPKRYKKQ